MKTIYTGVALQAQLTQEVKRADSLSAELERQQDDSSRGLKSSTKSHRGTGDFLTGGRTPSQGGVGQDPLIPASRPSVAGTTAGAELELLRRKLKVCSPLCCVCQTQCWWGVWS